MGYILIEMVSRYTAVEDTASETVSSDGIFNII